MTVYSFLSLVSRLIGIGQWAAFFWQKHEAKVNAQKVADAPITRKELEKTLEDGKL